MKINKFLITALLLLITISSYGQVAVIANKSVPENSISQSQLTDIYMLRSKTWSNGSAIVPLTIKTDNNTTNKFFAAVGKSSMEMKKEWMKIQLTGEGMAPEGLGSEAEMLTKVASTPGAIGFVDQSKVTGDVKVLLTIN